MKLPAELPGTLPEGLICPNEIVTKVPDQTKVSSFRARILPVS